MWGTANMEFTHLPVFLLRGETAASVGAAGISISQIVMLAFAVAALTLVMISTQRRLRRSRLAPRTSARERYTQLEERSVPTRDLERVMLELDELSRQIHGRLDTKLARLEAIIRDADQRIERLSRLTRAVEGGPAIEITLDREEPHDPPSTEPEVDDSRHAAVYRLADSGLSGLEIAREVGRTRGEVELILALRKTRKSAGRHPDPLTPLRPAS